MIISCMAREENKFSHATAQMAADKEAVGLSRVHMYVLEWQTHRCFLKTISNRKLLFFQDMSKKQELENLVSGITEGKRDRGKQTLID